MACCLRRDGAQRAQFTLGLDGAVDRHHPLLVTIHQVRHHARRRMARRPREAAGDRDHSAGDGRPIRLLRRFKGRDRALQEADQRRACGAHAGLPLPRGHLVRERG